MICELKLKMCLLLVEDSSEHKKVMSLNKKVAARTRYSEYKDVLLNINRKSTK